MAFPDLLTKYRVARFDRGFVGDDAANALPLSENREPWRWSDDDHQHDWITRAWEASVEDAARNLENLVVIHDNGGTASSPKKIKAAARELLRLLDQRNAS